MSKRILIIDDEVSIQESLSGILQDEGFIPLCASSAEAGIALLEEEPVDLALLDIWMGKNMDGMTALEKIKERFSLPVIMISGHGTIETAVQATRKGAYDFIEKPLSYDKIILAITNGLRFSQLEQANILLQENRTVQLTGNSAAIQAVREQIERVAPADAWVLIRGEHGTGKEIVAQSIHRLSLSCQQPMVELNCAAIPEELIESELFGHEKGSFTGAHTSKRGKFDQADGGILFLDEIGDMSLKTQAKILRILQEQKFERVGGQKTISVRVRVLAATNKNLEEEIEKGNFRADLFWRLNVVPIGVPALRERLEDIPLLVQEFLKGLADKGLGQKEFSDGAHQALMTHSWPGNVRELRNFIERVVIMCPGRLITEAEIYPFLTPDRSLHQIPLQKNGKEEIPPDGLGPGLSPYDCADFQEAKKIFERHFLQVKLHENQGNVSQTAEQIGMDRSHLHKKLKSLSLLADE